MPNITASTMSAQKASPIATKVLETLTDRLIFAPTFFDQAPSEKMDLRPKIWDASDQIKGPGKKGDTVKVPKVGRFYAQTKHEGIEITDQVLSSLTTELTLNVHKYVSVIVEDASEHLDNINLKMHIAREEGIALAEAFEDAIISLFSEFTTNTTVGTGSGDILGNDDYATLRKSLWKAGIDTNSHPMYHIVNPEQYAYLSLTRDEYQIAGDVGVKQFSSGVIKETPSGVRLMTSNRLSSTGGATTSLCFTDMSFMAAFAILPREKVSYDSKMIGTRYYADVLFGVAPLRKESAVLTSFDQDAA